MLTIDVDDYHKRPRFELQRMFYVMPRPFQVRESASGTGLHLIVPACQECDWRRVAFDDPVRVELDQQRPHKGLSVHNLLWDNKSGKTAGKWRTIRTERDIERWLDHCYGCYGVP